MNLSDLFEKTSLFFQTFGRNLDILDIFDGQRVIPDNRIQVAEPFEHVDAPGIND